MNRVENHLKEMAKPDLDFPLHQAKTRRLLLQKFERRSKLLFNMSFRKLLPVGIALVLILLLAPTLLPKPTPIVAPVSAAEKLINDALQKVQSMSPEALEKIRQKMNLDKNGEIVSILENAKYAPDLTIVDPVSISCEEAERPFKGPVDFMTSVEGNIDECKSAKRYRFLMEKPGFDLININGKNDDLIYLKYTQGPNHMVIGINQENLPLMILNLNVVAQDLNLTRYTNSLPEKNPISEAELKFVFPKEYENEYIKVEGTRLRKFDKDDNHPVIDGHVYLDLTYKNINPNGLYEIISFDQPEKFTEKDLSAYLVKNLPNRNLRPKKDEDYLNELKSQGWQHIVTEEREIWTPGLSTYNADHAYVIQGYVLNKKTNELLSISWTLIDEQNYEAIDKNYVQGQYDKFIDIMQKVEF